MYRVSPETGLLCLTVRPLRGSVAFASAQRLLNAAVGPTTCFCGKRSVAKVQAVLASLARMGFVSALGDAFVLRRAA
jgi:hypothetical protein